MSLKKSLLQSEQQTKVVTNSGLSYFAQQFNTLVDAKIGVVAGDLADHNHDEQYADKVLTEAHIADVVAHITADERTKWDAYEGAISSLHQLVSGKSTVNVVADLEALYALEGSKIGDLVYVLNTAGHAEGGENEALGFIYAEIDGTTGWHLFTDLEPSLHAKDLTVDDIAGVAGTTVQAVLENLALKIASEVARVEGLVSDLDAKVDAQKTDLEGQISAVDSKLDDEIADRVAANVALTEAINVVDAKVIALDGKVDTEIVRIDADIAKLREVDEILNTEIHYLSSILSLMSDRVDTNEEGVVALQKDAVAIKGRIDALEEQVGENLQGAIEDLKKELTDITDALDARVEVLEGKVTVVEEKLETVQEGAEVNQNAFATIKVGDVEVVATEKSDTFELAVGEGLIIEAVGKKVTVSIDAVENSEIDDIIASLTPSRR